MANICVRYMMSLNSDVTNLIRNQEIQICNGCAEMKKSLLTNVSLL